MPNMRPRLIRTLKDLTDFMTQAEANGATATTAIYWSDMHKEGNDDCHPPHDELLHPMTAIFTNEGGGTKPFITFEYWTPNNLYFNAVLNDQLGTPDHFTSKA